MRALVTGGTGFLGTWLTSELGRQGAKVVRLVRDRTFTEAGILNRVYGMVDVFGDVLDLPLLERVLAEYEIDTVFHLAAQAQVTTGQADPTGTLDVNIRGTWNMLEAARRQKSARVVVASSDKAYGSSKVLPYTEDMPLAGRSPYEVSKSTTDLLAQAYVSTYGMSIGITRCSNLYGGGHLNWSTLIPGTIRRLWRNERPVLFGGGEMVREFLYVEDAVRAYITLARSCHVGPFNFGGGEPRRVVDVVRDLIAATYSHIEPEIRGETRGEIQDQYLDSSRAKQLLGWEPKWSFADGLKETVRWYTEFFMTRGERVCL